MAEKEERIEQFITIKQRTITTRDYETNDEIISKIYTCQEAIERMANAAKKSYRGYFYAEPHHPNMSDMMEAALNALLGKE